MKYVFYIAGIIVSLWAGVSPAAAVIKTATYSGRLQSGNDLTGVFGAANTNLAGARYIATFTYDRNLGGDQASDPGVSDSSSGGSYYGSASPIVTASITINSITKTISGGFDDFVFVNVYPIVGHRAQQVELGALVLINNFVTANYITLTGGSSLDQDVAPTAAIVGSGSFRILTRDNLSGSDPVSAAGIFASEAIYSVGDGGVSAVPESASWAMLIAGFGLTGAALRRRRVPLAA